MKVRLCRRREYMQMCINERENTEWVDEIMQMLLYISYYNEVAKEPKVCDFGEGGGGVGRKAFSFRCGREKFEGKRKKNKFAFLEGGKDGVVITLGRGNKIS